MDDARSDHPDEGTIHAWLDDALDDATARALDAHVVSCAECTARVAEARGLIAGASRVVSALDDAPSGASPAWGQPPAAPAITKPGQSWAQRRLRLTPARAAIAATVLVALGVSVTYQRTGLNGDADRAMRSEKAAEMAAARQERGPSAPVDAPTTTPAAPTAAAPTIQPRDALFDSAVARNIAAAQPARVLKPAPGAGLPVPDVGRAGAAIAIDRTAPMRVAVGRATMQAQRDSTAGTAPDQLSTGRFSGRVAAEPMVSAAKRADSVASPPMATIAASASSVAQARQSVSSGQECYRVESANGTTAVWGPVALPLVIAVSTGPLARVLTPAGQLTEASASIVRTDDSLVFRLRRIGYQGTLALGAAGETRAGVMRSQPVQGQLESVVTTAVPSSNDATSERRSRAAARKDVPAAPEPARAEAAPASPLTTAPAVPVVVRRVSCPG
jgi:hypothetical protein